jgi:hypothetical protein
MTKGWKAYWVVVITIAVAAFVWVSLNIWFELIPPSCPDGHCPDPGSREFLAGLEETRRHWFLWAALSAVCWLAFSALVAGGVLALKRLFRAA